MKKPFRPTTITAKYYILRLIGLFKVPMGFKLKQGYDEHIEAEISVHLILQPSSPSAT